MRFSLRARFTAAYVAMFAALALFLSIAAFQLYQGWLLRQLDDELASRSALLREELVRQTGPLDAEAAVELTRRIDDSPELRRAIVAIFDREGRIVSRSRHAENRPLRLVIPFDDNSRDGLFYTVPTSDALHAELGDLRGTRLRFERDGEQYLAVLGVSMKGYARSVEAFRDMLILGGSIGVLLAAVGGYLVTGPITLRLRRLSTLASQISPDDLSRRISLADGQDEVAEIARSLNRMLERLEASHNRLERFAADASHELKTPLAALLAESAVLEDDPQVIRQFIRHSRGELTHLNALVDALLLLTRHERLPQVCSIDLGEVLATVASRLRGFASDYQNSVILDDSLASTDRCTMTVGDRRLIETLLECLLRHVITFTPAGESITCQINFRDERCVLEIRAAGPPVLLEKMLGIGVDSREASGPDRRRGAAVGLSVAARIAEMHQGLLTAESGEREVRFILDLPTSVTSSPSAPPAVKSPPGD